MNDKIPLLLLILVAGCAAQPQTGAEWIDVPLADNTYFAADREYRTGRYEIPVPAGAGLEFKLAMSAGDLVTYTLVTEHSDPAQLLIEFHGHTERTGDAPGTVMFYTSHNNGKEAGSMKAPFTGIHGWYIENRSNEDAVVTINIAGFYEEMARNF